MTQAHRTALATLVVAVAAIGAACVSENAPPTGTIDFTNDTDVHISVIRTNTELGLQSWFDLAPHLTQSHKPGETWTDGTVGVEFDEDDRYCQPNGTYWFVTPKDQTFISDGQPDADRLWTTDDVIDQIDGPAPAGPKTTPTPSPTNAKRSPVKRAW